MEPTEQIRFNIKAHDRIVATYEKVHGEIYNPTEQKRLREKLAFAVARLQTPHPKKMALDFGCGAGNITLHLLELGLQVTASDVSPRFVDLVNNRFSEKGDLKTFVLNGSDLSGIPDAHFDLAATYSVLHHIPDYLHAVTEMARVVKSGGVIYLDHEVNEGYWNPSSAYRELLRLTAIKPSLKRLLKPSTYYVKFRRTLNPRFQEEGDIHTFADDHIDWRQITQLLNKLGCETLLSEDYLLCRRHYPREVYERFNGLCTDMHLLIARKRSA